MCRLLNDIVVEKEDMQMYQTTYSGFSMATLRSTLVTIQISSNSQNPIKQQFEMNSIDLDKLQRGAERMRISPLECWSEPQNQ